MNAINRLDLLLTDTSISSSKTNPETSIEPISRLTFSERDACPSSRLPPAIATTVPLPPRRDSSSMKHHRRRHQINHQTDEQKQQYQPLLNSSTLDDLFRALTLECEQYLAASSYQNKTYDQPIAQPSPTIQAAVESNDEDYENLHPPPVAITTTTTTSSPLKTSIQVISPIKRHVVSITVSSKITSPNKTSCINVKPIPSAIIRHSSEEETKKKSSLLTSTNRKHRRRRTRKQYLSSTTPTTRSSSSSTERKEVISDKKPIISKRSCSTDPRYQQHITSHENSALSPQKSSTKRPRRRDVSLQHTLPHSRRFQENYSSPLSVLLTSTKPTSDFLDHSHQQQQRRSRLESVNQRSSTLLDRLHPQFYRPSPTRNNTNNRSNILPHRIPSYPVY